MTKQLEIYYYYEDHTRTIFWSETFDENLTQFIFLGSSMNPNKRMAVAAFTHKMGNPKGWKIKQLPV